MTVEDFETAGALVESQPLRLENHELELLIDVHRRILHYFRMRKECIICTDIRTKLDTYERIQEWRKRSE